TGREGVVIAGLAAGATAFRMGLAAMAVTLLAVATVAWLRRGNRVLLFLGTVSYSLYLLHSPIGRRALNLARRLTGAQSPLATAAVFVFAVAASLVAASLLY